VNTRSQDDDTRHKALVGLMRTFIHYNEFNNAIAVSDYLKKENLNQDNKLRYFLTSAYKYQLEEDYENMVLFLKEAVRLEKSKKHAAREYFVLGQVYQHLHNDSAAFAAYKKCLKKSPDYELSF
jgi:lipopolysaccharide biosynthesis regulator YciM